MCRFLITLHQKLLVMPVAALALLAAAAGSLAFAYSAENFFGIAPCELCLYQRVPYAVVIALALLALLIRKNDKKARCLLGLCAVAFFVNMGIAFYHSGVELHWWGGTDDCAANPLLATDPALVREALMNTPVVRCDQINFTFLGFTMANWNVLASFALGLFALLASFGPCVNWGKGCCCCKKDGCCG